MIGGIIMLKESDMNLTADYEHLGILESALGHELKSVGILNFCKKYESDIDMLKESWDFLDFCYLLAFLSYYDSSFEYDQSVRLDKYIPDPYDLFYYNNRNEEGFEDCVKTFDKMYEDSLPSMRLRGFLFSDIDEAV